jgi:hypoxanthine phosphoribosyltransferase
MEKIYNDIKKVLISKEEIEARVKEIGKQITEEFAGEEVVLVGVLKGSFIFMSDLARNIDLPVDIDFIIASSYSDGMETSGNVKIIKDINIDVKNKVVIMIEDIVDTGLTMNNLKEIFKVRRCKNFKICTLLDKKERRKVQIEADYIGFEVPNEFVVGYGLDYAGKYRNLPEVSVLKEEIYK